MPQKPRFGTLQAMSPSSLNAFENKSAPHSALVKANDGAERGKSSQQDQNAGDNYGRGTRGVNWGSFGVPIRRESCTSHGSQPWLISTSDWMDIYI